jgi:RNA polymerase sigma-70 factor (ECF subfamily)
MMNPNLHSPVDGMPSTPDTGATDDADPGRLFMGHRDRLRRMVEIRMDGRLRGRVDPSDILQEAYIEFARSLPGFLRKPDIPMFLWLRHITAVRLKVAHRTHLGTRMRDARREVGARALRLPNASSDYLASQLLGRMSSPSQAAARAELQTRVRDALDGLAPLDREVLCLRHFEQLSNSEASQVLGISETAASNRYIRALKRIARTLHGFSQDLK